MRMGPSLSPGLPPPWHRRRPSQIWVLGWASTARGGEGFAEGDLQDAISRSDGRNGSAGHHAGLAPGLLQGKSGLLGAHLAAIVKTSGAQCESPLQTVIATRPLAGKPGLQIAFPIDIHQGLRHLHASKEDPLLAGSTL